MHNVDIWYLSLDHIDIASTARMARLECLFKGQPQKSKTQTTDNLVGIINRIVHF
jgi:hypothetical protein